MRLALCCLLLLLGACSFGTTTTQRPAVDKPAVAPDGAFWDAANVAGRQDVDAFLYILTPRFIHSELWPSVSRAEPTSINEYSEQHARLNRELALVDSDRRNFARGHMQRLAQVLQDRYVEVSRPSYDIKYRDDVGRAAGPNRATVTVRAWPKGAVKEGEKPDQFKVSFLQYGQRWLIDDIEPNPLKGTFQLPLSSRPTTG